MNEAVQPEMLVQLAVRVRINLQMADALGLNLVAIHLNDALLAMSDCEGTGAITPEPCPESLVLQPQADERQAKVNGIGEPSAASAVVAFNRMAENRTNR